MDEDLWRVIERKGGNDVIFLLPWLLLRLKNHFGYPEWFQLLDVYHSGYLGSQPHLFLTLAVFNRNRSAFFKVEENFDLYQVRIVRRIK